MIQEQNNECAAPSTVVIPKRSKGSNDDPVLELANRVRNQIESALHRHMLMPALNCIGYTGYDESYKSRIEGHSLKVSKALLPEFFALCQDVKSRLGFEEDVDFYITGNSEVNAYAIASPDDEHPHIINIYSALFNIMNDDEKRFIIGHEIGHLMFHDSEFGALISFVYPDDEKYEIPMVLKHKIRLVNQLAELMADRCGYAACGNLDACITAMYKMSSGLDLMKMGVSIDQLLRDNNNHLDYFVNDEGLSHATHPVNPIRIQAINLIASNNESKINRGMRDLLSVLIELGDSPFDRYMALFLASAGIKMAMLDDNKVTNDELDEILANLSEITIFAMEYLQKIYRSDVEAQFNHAVDVLMENAPGMRDKMLSYVISIAMANKVTTPEQFEFILNLGRRMGMNDREIARHIAIYVREGYEARLRE